MVRGLNELEEFVLSFVSKIPLETILKVISLRVLPNQYRFETNSGVICYSVVTRLLRILYASNTDSVRSQIGLVT